MKKIIFLTIIASAFTLADNMHRIDSGMPTLEELIQDKYVYESVELLKINKEKKENKENLQRSIFDSWDKRPSLDLKSTVVEKSNKRENATNIYDIDEIEVKGHLLYRNNKLIKNSYVRTYYENVKSEKRKLKEEMQITEGYINGLIKEYHLNGNLKRKYNYINNKKEGKEELYDGLGRIREVSIYKNNKKDGLRVVYDIDGEEIYNIEYKNGVIDGEVREYYKNKYIKRKIKYINNKKHGNGLAYAENGNVIKRKIYENGNMQEENIYNSWSGGLYRTIVYKNNKPYIEKIYDYEGNFQKEILLEKKKERIRIKQKEEEIVPKESVIFEKEK